MRKLLLVPSIALLWGCAANHPAQRVERPVNVTHEVAMGDYRRVFNTAYHIVNRYAAIQSSSYRSGVITALVKEDTSLFEKTRQEIEARIVSHGDYYDVQCRVLYKVEDSEPATFPDQFNPLYSWKTVASDPALEVRLNSEIRAALSGGAWEQKEPLRPKPTRPEGSAPAPRPAERKAGGGETGEVSSDLDAREASALPEADAFDRLGVVRLRHGAYEGAAKAFAASLERDPRAPFARYLLAQALFSQGSFRSAQVALEEAYALNPRWIESGLDLRDLYGSEAADFTARLEGLRAAAADDPELELLLGYMRLGSDDAPGALAALDRYLADRGEESLARALRQRARERVDAAHGLVPF